MRGRAGHLSGSRGWASLGSGGGTRGWSVAGDKGGVGDDGFSPPSVSGCGVVDVVAGILGARQQRFHVLEEVDAAEEVLGARHLWLWL